MKVALAIIGWLSAVLCVLLLFGFLFTGQVVADLEESGVTDEPSGPSWVIICVQVICVGVLLAAGYSKFVAYRLRLWGAAGLLVLMIVWDIWAFNAPNLTLADELQEYIVSGVFSCAVAQFVAWASLTAVYRH